jgi:hypothetical protein
MSVEPERREEIAEPDEEAEQIEGGVGTVLYEDEQHDQNGPQQQPEITLEQDLSDEGLAEERPEDSYARSSEEVEEVPVNDGEYGMQRQYSPLEDGFEDYDEAKQIDEDPPPAMDQTDDDEDVDFVHVNTSSEHDQLVAEVSEAPSAPTAKSQKAVTESSDSPDYSVHRSTTRAPAQGPLTTDFDFYKVTPLHVKHPIQPLKERTPPVQRPRVSYPITERSFHTMNQWEGAFSPLPRRASPVKSPAPFSKRDSSPATEEDADMWRSMIGQPPRRRSSGVGRLAAERESMAREESNSEAESEVDAPEATSRTIGDATMMQSEDFSMVSLSSLPSAKDINSSLLGQSEGAQSRSLIDRSKLSSRKPSRLHKAVTFSSPLAQSVHSPREPSTSDSDSDDELGYSLPQKRTPQRSSSHGSQQASNDKTHIGNNEAAPTSSRHPTPPSQPRPATRRDYSVTHTPVVQAQQTPVTEPARLPTPNSGENQSSPPHRNEQLHSDISYPEIDEFEQQVQHTPAKSEAEMSTPPATPPERNESPRLKRAREVSLASSGGSTKRSWVDEPKSARMIALENKWQEDRDNVLRTLAQAKGPAVRIESDEESSQSEGEEDEREQDEEQQIDPEEATTPTTAHAPAANETADIWQDISASFDDGDSLPHAHRRRPIYTRPTHTERPSKFARTEARHSPGGGTASHEAQATTPQKSYDAEHNMASVQRRAKTKADVSALFGRVASKVESKAPSFNMQTKSASPAKPSPLRHVYVDGTVDETDISALSDVRQIRNEIKNAAQRRPPFPVATRGTTVMVPTKLKSIDDTLTTHGDDEEMDVDVQDQSVISFTGQRQASRSLFSGPSSSKQVSTALISDPQPQFLKSAVDGPAAVAAGDGVFSYIWKTLTFSHPYIPPPRPSHAILLSAEDKYPLLPSVWAWSHTHWQTLDNLYQYYKRKPSRFSPARTARPDNTGLMTPQWTRFIDITFDHWGYRVRLEDTHIVLAILFMRLLVLPSKREYVEVYGSSLEYRVHQNKAERVGERITEWDVLRHVFAIVSGEMLREDEAVGRKVRRDLVEFRYKLKGQDWRHVHDAPGF